MSDVNENQTEAGEESEDDLRVLRTERVQTYKPHSKRDASNAQLENRTVKKPKLEDASGSGRETSVIRNSTSPEQNSNELNRHRMETIIPLRNRPIDNPPSPPPPSDPTGRIHSTTPGIPYYPVTNYAPSFRSNSSHIHRHLWIRQQLESETRRRYFTATVNVSSAQPVNLPIDTLLSPFVILPLLPLPMRGYTNDMPIDESTSKIVIDSSTMVFTYKASVTEMASANQQISCVVCLNKFETNQRMRRLPCLHIFHKSCVDQWLKNNWHCPICRHKINTVTTAQSETTTIEETTIQNTTA